MELIKRTELKLDVLNLLKNKTSNKKFLSLNQIKELENYINTEKKPTESNTKEFQSFYRAYGRLRNANNIFEKLKKLGLIQ